MTPKEIAEQEFRKALLQTLERIADALEEQIPHLREIALSTYEQKDHVEAAKTSLRYLRDLSDTADALLTNNIPQKSKK